MLDNTRERVEKESREEIVDWFAKIMKSKLSENTHKGLWRDLDTSTLLQYLKQELGELEEALVNREHPYNVAREAGDIANFAMMIADKTVMDARREVKDGYRLPWEIL